MTGIAAGRKPDDGLSLGPSSAVARADCGASNGWDDFALEEQLYDEIFRLRRRLWIERAALLVTALVVGCIGAGYV